MRVLITGGAGFIGSQFTRDLLDEGGFEVTVLDKLTYAGNLDNLATVADHDCYTFVQGNISDSALVSSSGGPSEPLSSSA